MSGYQEEKERVAGWRLYEGVGTRRRRILPTFPPLPRRYTFLATIISVRVLFYLRTWERAFAVVAGRR